VGRRTAAWIAWGLAAAVIVVATFVAIEGVRQRGFDGDAGAFVESLAEVLIAPILALLAALIIFPFTTSPITDPGPLITPNWIGTPPTSRVTWRAPQISRSRLANASLPTLGDGNTPTRPRT
jgi:hypothetical protein